MFIILQVHITWKKNTMILRKDHSGPLALKWHITLREIFEGTLIK